MKDHPVTRTSNLIASELKAGGTSPSCRLMESDSSTTSFCSVSTSQTMWSWKQWSSMKAAHQLQPSLYMFITLYLSKVLAHPLNSHLKPIDRYLRLATSLKPNRLVSHFLPKCGAAKNSRSKFRVFLFHLREEGKNKTDRKNERQFRNPTFNGGKKK